MNYSNLRTSLLAYTIVATSTSAWAGQAPGAATSPTFRSAITIRVYAARTVFRTRCQSPIPSTTSCSA